MDVNPDKTSLRASTEGPKLVRVFGKFKFLGVGVLVRALHEWFRQHRDRQRICREDAPSLQVFRRLRPELNSVQHGLLGQLEENGIASTQVSTLVGNTHWRELRDTVNTWLRTPETQAREDAYLSGKATSGKAYLVTMFGKGSSIDWSSQWLRFAVMPEILDLVNSYLGLMSRLNTVDVWDTVPRIHDGPDIGSQRWHRDPEATRMLKVFLYFSDVDRDSGPMYYVRQSRKGDRYGHLWPQKPPLGGSVPPVGSIDAVVPMSAFEICTFSAGTLVFADTSGLHRGGRASTNRRVLGAWTFVPPSSVWPRRFSVDNDMVPNWLSPAARYALLPAEEEMFPP